MVPDPVGFTAAVAAFTTVALEGVRAAASADFDFHAHEAALVDAARRLATSGVREVAAATRPRTELVQVDGALFKRMAAAKPGTYRGLDGEFQIDRHLYRQVGVHNGPTVDPVAVRCGMVDGRYTPAWSTTTIRTHRRQLQLPTASRCRRWRSGQAPAPRGA